MTPFDFDFLPRDVMAREGAEGRVIGWSQLVSSHLARTSPDARPGELNARLNTHPKHTLDIMSSRAKQVAAPARPAGRYFKGKAPTNENVDSDSDDVQEEEEDAQPKEEDVGGDMLVSAPSRASAGKGMNVSLGKMGVTKEGKVTGGKQEGQSSSHLSFLVRPATVQAHQIAPLHCSSRRELIRGRREL